MFLISHSLRVNTIRSIPKARTFHTTSPFKMAAIVETVKNTIAENFGGGRYLATYPKIEERITKS